jgi:hypothetical protein
MTTEFVLAVSMTLVYRLGIVASGTLTMWLGYKLFLAGVFEKAGASMAVGDRKLRLTNAAPGTFFALFGSSVVGFCVLHPPTFDLRRERDIPQRMAVGEDASHVGSERFVSAFCFDLDRKVPGPLPDNQLALPIILASPELSAAAASQLRHALEVSGHGSSPGTGSGLKAEESPESKARNQTIENAVRFLQGKEKLILDICGGGKGPERGSPSGMRTVLGAK